MLIAIYIKYTFYHTAKAELANCLTLYVWAILSTASYFDFWRTKQSAAGDMSRTHNASTAFDSFIFKYIVLQVPRFIHPMTVFWFLLSKYTYKPVSPLILHWLFQQCLNVEQAGFMCCQDH